MIEVPEKAAGAWLHVMEVRASVPMAGYRGRVA
jgi:hypothetical protein